MSAPQAIDQEAAAIGAVLFNDASLDALLVDVGLRPEHFHRPRHESIWRAITALHDRSEPVDVLTVCAELGGGLEESGGQRYVQRLPMECPSPGNARAYAALVVEMATRRQEVEAGKLIQQGGETGDRDLVARGEGLLAARGEVSARRLTKERRQADLLELFEGRQATKWRWPWPEMDRMTGGVWPGHLTVVAGQSGAGKSCLLDQVAEAIAAQGARVALFPNDGTPQSRDVRLVNRRTGIPLLRLLRGNLQPGEHEPAVKAIKDLPFDIVPAGGMSAKDIARTARRERLDFALVDLLNGLPGSSETRDIDENVRTLANFAVESGCHVIAAQHLNRRSFSGPYPPEPNRGDVRGSGQIVDLCTNLIFVYRRERTVFLGNGDEVGTGKPGSDAVINLDKVKDGIDGRLDTDPDVRFNSERLRFEVGPSMAAEEAA